VSAVGVLGNHCGLLFNHDGNNNCARFSKRLECVFRTDFRNGIHRGIDRNVGEHQKEDTWRSTDASRAVAIETDKGTVPPFEETGPQPGQRGVDVELCGRPISRPVLRTWGRLPDGHTQSHEMPGSRIHEWQWLVFHMSHNISMIGRIGFISIEDGCHSINR
jgi:hypothetical protein